MTSEQLHELVGSNANAGQDAAQCALGHVPPCVDWHGDRAPVGMAHHVVATLDPCYGEAGAFESPDDLRSRYGRDAARHKTANYQRSRNVECQRHLVWYPHLFDEEFQAGAEVGERLILGLPLTERGHARTKLSGSTPGAVFVLLDDVGDMNNPSHLTSITCHVYTS
jgi:hypothetical protein